MALIHRSGLGDAITEGGPVGNQLLTFPPVTITGEPPKSLAAQVLPWLIGIAVLGTVYYFAEKSFRRRRRARAAGAPFVG